MMNDRFSAQLRQHLLESADERPADGQLATVIDRVADTPQRHPVVARLTWLPGRVGPFPSTALRYGVVALALIGATVAAAMLGGGSNPPFRSTVFEGTWTSIDPLDGSKQWLFVGPGNTPDVRYEDELSTGGACIDDEVKHFIGVGSGEITGPRLDVSFPDGGGCGLMTVSIPVLYYVHDPVTDTLVDHFAPTPSPDPEVAAGHMSAVWSRVTLGTRPATQPPAKEPPATQAPLPEPTSLPELTPVPTPEGPTDSPDCIDLAQGGTYTALAGSLSVTATIPDSPAIPWQGSPDGFYLGGWCGPIPPITFVASTATTVLATSCMPESLEITSFADAVARLDTPTGDDISDRVDLTIGGHAAARYDITNLSTCWEGFGLWEGTTVGLGETGSLYVIDVDGVLLSIELSWYSSLTPAQLEEAWAIVASLQIGP